MIPHLRIGLRLNQRGITYRGVTLTFSKPMRSNTFDLSDHPSVGNADIP